MIIRATISKLRPKLLTAKAQLLAWASQQESKRVAFLLLFIVASYSLLLCRRRTQYPRGSAQERYELAVRADEARVIRALSDASVHQRACGVHPDHHRLMDSVPYNRSIPDVRHPLCARAASAAALPAAAAVVTFHDAPYAAVLRTLWNLLLASGRLRGARGGQRRGGRGHDRTNTTIAGDHPETDVFLKEILLVDDASTREHLQGKLAHYVRTRLPPGLVRIIRLPHYVGRTHARAIGARAANGEVLVFMEAGSEGSRDWLRPLLQRVKTNPAVVAVPAQDQIDAATLEYSEIVQFETLIGGFDFSGNFIWLPVPGARQARPASKIDPVPSPAMYGRVFAIHRSLYRAVGGLQDALADRAGDALQLSLKIWMCGGSIETIPCSHVGSLEPPVEPPDAGDAGGDVRGARAQAAAGWMDEYAELFFMFNPEYQEQAAAPAEDVTSAEPPPGDVTSSLELRARLRCRPFSWYMRHVYPDKFLPFVDVVAWGRLHTSGGRRQLCATGGSLERARVQECAPHLLGAQLWALDAQQRLRNDEKCLVIFARFVPIKQKGVVFMVCTVGESRPNERWELHAGQLRHIQSGSCLDAGWLRGAPLQPGRCGEGNTQLDFDFHGDQSMFTKKKLFSSKEQLITLEKIRHARAAELRNASAPAAGADTGTGHVDTGIFLWGPFK